MVVTYRLLGQPVNPVNRKDIFLEINHDQQAIIDQALPHVGIRNLYFANEDILKVMAYLNNPPGITEGAPFQIEVKEKGQTEVINMYLDLMQNFFRSKDGISCSVKMVDSIDHLDDQVNGFTFESMYNETGVTPFYVDNIYYPSYQKYLDDRCIYVPYVISTIPDKQNAFMALIGVVFVSIQIYRAVKDLTAEATPVNWLMLISEIIFIIALVVTLIKLVEQMIGFLIQPLKYHGAMLMLDMMKLIAVKTGRNFISSKWNSYPYNCIAWMPSKYEPPTVNVNSQWSLMGSLSLGMIQSVNVKAYSTSGYTSPGYAPATPHDSATPNIQHGYFEGVGGDLLRIAKKVINGKIIIPNGTTDLVMERRDYSPNPPTFTLPDVRQDWNGYNTEELYANMIIRFTKDLNDKNVIDKYEGTIYQITHQQVNTVNKHLSFLKGLREINIEAARGIRKTAYTSTEEHLNDILVALNTWQPLIISIMNTTVFQVNGAILAINGLISGINGFILAIVATINVINAIINFINLTGAGISNISQQANPFIPFIQPISIVTPATFPIPASLPTRIGALLVENDFVSVPKMLLIDKGRTEWNQRIAFLHVDNGITINAKYLWDNSYYIDAFVGTPNNRRTKITPALNSDSEINPILLSVAGFKSLVPNPNFNDNFAEPVVADSVQWFIEKNGSANISFRKQGWLRDPQNKDGAKRAQEININLQLKKSLPNGN